MECFKKQKQFLALLKASKIVPKRVPFPPKSTFGTSEPIWVYPHAKSGQDVQWYFVDGILESVPSVKTAVYQETVLRARGRGMGTAGTPTVSISGSECDSHFDRQVDNIAVYFDIVQIVWCIGNAEEASAR